jgi:hypothetical protein
MVPAASSLAMEVAHTKLPIRTWGSCPNCKVDMAGTPWVKSTATLSLHSFSMKTAASGSVFPETHSNLKEFLQLPGESQECRAGPGKPRHQARRTVRA